MPWIPGSYAAFGRRRLREGAAAGWTRSRSAASSSRSARRSTSPPSSTSCSSAPAARCSSPRTWRAAPRSGSPGRRPSPPIWAWRRPGGSWTPTRWAGSPRSRGVPSASISTSRRWPTSTTIPPTRSSTPGHSARIPRRWRGWWSRPMRGLQEHGMLATVKHFPGHGDTGTDSHIALPVITRRLGPARLGRTGAVPGGDQGRRRGGHVGAPRAPGHRQRSRPPGHPHPRDPHRRAARLAGLRGPRGHRRPRHGRHRQRSTAPEKRRSWPSSPGATCCCSRPTRASPSTPWSPRSSRAE